MVSLGVEITMEEAEDMVDIADKNGDGTLDMYDFTRIILGTDEAVDSSDDEGDSNFTFIFFVSSRSVNSENNMQLHEQNSAKIIIFFKISRNFLKNCPAF